VVQEGRSADERGAGEERRGEEKQKNRFGESGGPSLSLSVCETRSCEQHARGMYVYMRLLHVYYVHSGSVSQSFFTYGTSFLPFIFVTFVLARKESFGWPT